MFKDSKKKCCTDWYNSRIVGDEVPGCNMACLVFVTSDVKGEFHGTVRAKLIAGAILRGKEDKKNAVGQLEVPIQ